MPYIEWLNLGDVNFQGRGILGIYTDSVTSLDIVFKRNQYDEMKELYEILLPYMRRLVFNNEERKLTIYNKGNDDPLEKPINKVNVSNPKTFLTYDNIIGYEIVCDKVTVNDDYLQNVAAGKYVAGSAGILLGAVSSINSGEYISNLQIKLHLNNMEKPCVYVNYITRKIKKNSLMAKDLIKMCDEDFARLEIIFKKDKPEPVIKNESSHETSSKDPIEEIKKFKELLDMGIISQEEFDMKKKELLNL